MITLGFKAGSGTASRIVEWQGRPYLVGAFVQSNFGKRRNFTLRGLRVGSELTEPTIREGTPRAERARSLPSSPPMRPSYHTSEAAGPPRAAWHRHAGGFGYHSSGDIFLAFSTANPDAALAPSGRIANATFIPDSDIDPFFDAVIQTVEESILNAMVANDDMTGRDGNFVPALPRDRLAALFG